jgi:CubicO group peptidase (beta-lactamase class C family)
MITLSRTLATSYPAQRPTALRERRMSWLPSRAPGLCFSALVALGCGASDVTDVDDHGGDAPSEPSLPPAKPPADEAAVARVAEVWQEATENGFSGVALVRHRGQELGRFAAGQSDREQGLPNTPETAFDIGSITKQFTAAAIMRLYEQGRLDLQAPLGELFEGVPGDKAGVTVHQLLTHTAGFASALGDDDEPIERAAYLQRAWDRPFSVQPGTLHWYSNAGYSILGAIVERLSGRSYDEHLVGELLRPLGIEHTGYLGPVWDPSKVALGYLEDGTVDDPLARPHASDGYYWNLRANGGLLSTLADMTRWSDALLGGDVLGPEALERYLTPHVREGLGSEAHYAYGWSVQETPVGRLITHNGANGYFFAEVSQYVDAELLVIMLANESNAAADTLALDLAAAVLPALPSADVLPDPEPLAIDRVETIEDATQSLVETIEFTAEHDAAVAGFFIDLEAGSATFRLRAPGGEVFETGSTRPGEPLERIIVVPPRPGPWRLEVDLEGATGEVFFAWLWD